MSTLRITEVSRTASDIYPTSIPSMLAPHLFFPSFTSFLFRRYWLAFAPFWSVDLDCDRLTHVISDTVRHHSGLDANRPDDHISESWTITPVSDLYKCPLWEYGSHSFNCRPSFLVVSLLLSHRCRLGSIRVHFLLSVVVFKFG